MKKTIIISILASLCAFGYAQKKMPAMPYPGHSEIFLESLKDARRMGLDVSIDEAALEQEQQKAPAAVAAEADTEVGYLNPAGTLFLGFDEAGKGTFMKAPGVIGAWSDSIPCWKWINQRTRYKTVKYLTSFLKEYPSYNDGENYYVDQEGNFCDTILASGGYQDAYAMDADGDAGYYWQHATPLQTTKYNDGTEKTYMMLSSASKPSADKCPIAAGGLPTSNTSDGLWPLTNAVSTSRSGVSTELIANTEGDGMVDYFFGSSLYTVDSVMIPNAAQDADSMTYERYKPVKISTYYSHPQAPLYIKSVTLALCSDKYTKQNQGDLKFDTLYMRIKDEAGNELAYSVATEANLGSHMTYKNGKLLTFYMQDTTAYGEILREGLLVDKAFIIEITGFKDTDNWAIYAAKSTVHASKSEMYYEGGVVKKIAYDPYIMLNGIYPTLENYLSSRDIETGQVGDTIPVNFVSYNANGYQYIASYAKLGADYNEFAFYSTFVPYDSLKRTWTFDIEQPDYIQMVADYEYNISGDDEDPITLWSYYRLFTLYIYAKETPRIGDCIKFGKAGKSIVLRIDEINGSQDINQLSAVTKLEKVLKNGQVLIRKNGHVYNTFGQKIQ